MKTKPSDKYKTLSEYIDQYKSLKFIPEWIDVCICSRAANQNYIKRGTHKRFWVLEIRFFRKFGDCAYMGFFMTIPKYLDKLRNIKNQGQLNAEIEKYFVEGVKGTDIKPPNDVWVVEGFKE